MTCFRLFFIHIQIMQFINNAVCLFADLDMSEDHIDLAPKVCHTHTYVMCIEILHVC